MAAKVSSTWVREETPTTTLSTRGKPPMYSVMIKSPAKDLLRRQIGQILSRPFALGATSFMLTGSEAASLVGRDVVK